MRPSWDPPEADRTHAGPTLAQWIAIRGCRSCIPTIIICAQKIMSGTHLRAVIPSIVQSSVKHANDPLCCCHRSIIDGMYPSMSVELKNTLLVTMVASHNMVSYYTINHTIAKAWNWTLVSTVLVYIDGLVQDCGNSISNELELLQSCTKPSLLIQSKS